MTNTKAGKKFQIFLFFVLNVLFQINVLGQKCKDYLIYDFADPVKNYGIDTTGNWWILTQPYSGGFRYIINTIEYPIFNYVSKIQFSPNGEDWAFYANDFSNMFIVTPDTIISFFAEKFIDFGFNQNGSTYYWVIANGIETEIHFNNRVVKTINNVEKVFINNEASKFAMKIRRGNVYILATDDYETDFFDEIQPLGFFEDNSFIFAARKGKYWQIYRDKKPIYEPLEYIIEARINNKGTTAAFLVRNTIGDAFSLILSDEFSEILTSSPYDNCSNLTLHPFEPLVAFLSVKNGNYNIVYGNSEINLGNFPAYPYFTNDGSELLFSFCNIDCYLYVDGIRQTIPSGLISTQKIARKPKSTTFCIGSSTGMIMYDYYSAIQYTGTLVDEVSKPVYVYRDSSYQALGKIGNKIYLLTCKP
ncbi:MAG: hypothetical protein ACUVQ1_01155 [Candidatus Kapaibacteriales bacterium]